MMRLLTTSALLAFFTAAHAQPNAGIVRRTPLSFSGIYPSNVMSSPSFEIDFSQTPPGAGATFVANTGQTLTQRGSGITRLTDGTWPNGVDGGQGDEWSFDGATNSIDSSIGPPSGDFSVVCVVTPKSIAANRVIIGNYASSLNKRGWMIFLPSTTGSLSFLVSDDGTTNTGHYSSVSLGGVLAAGRTSIVAASYDYVTDGTSIGRLYCDQASAASSVLDGPVYSGAASLSIGAEEGAIPGTLFPGFISHCTYWDGVVLTSAQVNAIMDTWNGVLSTSGVKVGTTSASPPAIQVAPGSSGTEPFLRSFGAHTNTIANNGSCRGLYSASSITNKVWRGSLETWSSGSPVGWTESVTSTGDCVQTTDSKAHLYSSARCTTSDADDAVSLTSGCSTVSGSTVYQVSTWAKGISGSPLMTVSVIEDDSADCSSPTVTTDVISGAVPGATWGIYRGSVTTAASTIRSRVRVTLPASAAKVIDIDAVMMRQAPTANTTTDAYCAADTDSDAACSSMINYTSSPHSVNGPTTVDLKACSPWSGTEITSARYVYYDSSATDFFYAVVHYSYDEPALYIVSGGMDKSVRPNVYNWQQNTEYDLKFGHDGSGHLRLFWGGSWNTTMVGSGDGIRKSGATNTYIGGSDTDVCDLYTRDIVVYRRVIP